jgi:hypothetical protein
MVGPMVINSLLPVLFKKEIGMNDNEKAVSLSIADWLDLLRELEHLQRFINRDTHKAKTLHKKIISQLN